MAAPVVVPALDNVPAARELLQTLGGSDAAEARLRARRER
jgi:hypothetical protein